MRFKKHLANVLVCSFLHWKSLGMLVFVPLVIMNLLLPALNYLVYMKYGIGDKLYTSILQYSQWFLPISSIWWPTFVLKEYIEGDGNELLYVNQNSNKLADLSCLFIFSVLNITLLFSVYTALLPHMKYEYVRILSVCLFYFGLAYALSFLTKSTTITLLAIILYTVANIYYGRGRQNNLFIYCTTERVTMKNYVSDSLPLLLIGLLLITIGVIVNRKRLWFRMNI